jgi:predicted transcriptional regulator
MGERPDKKKALSVYLDPDIMRMLDDFACRREKSRSVIAEAAIASFLSPDADQRQEAAIVKRLDRIDRNLQRLERDLGIAIESLAIFIRSWLTATTTMPETAQAAARAKGGERYEKFLEVLGRRLAKGPRLRQEVPEDVPAADRTDFAK